MCEFWSAQCELRGCCCSAQRVLCESCPAQQILVFPSFVDASAHFVHETVCSWLETWHAPRLKKISCVHLIPHGSGACVCLSLFMEARLIALEDRLRQTEEVFVAERLARQTAEAASWWS